MPWKPQLDVVVVDQHAPVAHGVVIDVWRKRIDPDTGEDLPSGTNWTNPNILVHGQWDLPDITDQGTSQISAVHEMGHVIGLRHPGTRTYDPQRNRYNESGGYSADPNALMGYGMELRTFYFAAWQEKMNQISPAQAPWTLIGPPSPEAIPGDPRRY
jgi:hypothetical protein